MCNYPFSVKGGTCVLFLSCSDYGASHWDDGSTGWMDPEHLSPWGGGLRGRIVEIYGRLCVSKKYTIYCVVVLRLWVVIYCRLSSCVLFKSHFPPRKHKVKCPLFIASGKAPLRYSPVGIEAAPTAMTIPLQARQVLSGTQSKGLSSIHPASVL